MITDTKPTRNLRLTYGDIDLERTPVELDLRADAAFAARLLSDKSDFTQLGRHLRAIMAEQADCTHIDTTDAVLQALTRCCTPAFGELDWPTYHTAAALCAGAELLNDEHRRAAANETSMTPSLVDPLVYRVTRNGEFIGYVRQIEGSAGWFWMLNGDGEWRSGCHTADEAWSALLVKTRGAR